MNYLNTFESFNNNKNREFFNDKIDWNLFSFIKDKLLQYEDDGQSTFIYVGSIPDMSSIGCTIYKSEEINKHIIVNYTSDYNNDFADTRLFDKNYSNYNKNKTLLYQVEVVSVTDEEAIKLKDIIIEWYKKKYGKELKTRVNTGVIKIYVVNE